MARRIDIDDNFSTSTEPDQGEINSTRARSAATESAYETYLTAQGITLAAGHWFWDSTLSVVKIYDGSAWYIQTPWTIGQQSATIANAQAVAANVTNMLLGSSVYHTVSYYCEIHRKTDSNEVKEWGWLHLAYYESTSTWDISPSFVGDDSGVDLTVTAAGQVQYVSDSLAGSNYEGTLKFKAIALED